MKHGIQKPLAKEKEETVCRTAGWLRLMRSFLYITLAVLLCSCCALSVICYRRAPVRAFYRGEMVEQDRIRIYIDQGHNPTPHHNMGAEGNGLYEQDVTFAIGCRLAELLRDDGRFEVCLSRPEESTVLGTDTMTSLRARVEGATAFDADYFISLHINSYTQDTVKGIEVFAVEDDESYAFGSALLQGMVDSTSLNNRGMKPSSELYVLENASMPAVLLEMGFISNAEDAAFLREQPELFAQGIYEGILEYFTSFYALDLQILLWTVGTSSAFAVILTVGIRTVGRRSQKRAKLKK